VDPAGNGNTLRSSRGEKIQDGRPRGEPHAQRDRAVHTEDGGGREIQAILALLYLYILANALKNLYSSFTSKFAIIVRADSKCSSFSKILEC
jgi:hypothetical protein